MKQGIWAVAIALALTGSLAHAEEDLAAANQPAPPFGLPAYNPQPNDPPIVPLYRFVGPNAQAGVKAVLLSFMSSSCAPCKKEMPYLQKLQEQYKAQGLQVLMVSIDTEPAGQKVVADLLAQNKVTFPVLKDRFKLVARRWLGNESPLPSVFLIRGDGTITTVHRGYDEKTSLQLASEVRSALGLKAAN